MDKIKFMKSALKQAEIALKRDEVPIGAVIVKDGKIISRGYNKRQQTKNAINHAEIIAIQKATKVIGDWRLENCDIYITLEPCPMCLGAIANARIKNVYFGAYDKNSKINYCDLILKDTRLNHKCNVEGGLLEDSCSQILSIFFKNKRK